MDRRIRFRQSGLLGFLLIFLLCVPVLWPQEEDSEKLTLQTASTPASPITGGTWTFTVLADYPNAQELIVQPPQFPSNLVLERVRTDLRVRRTESSDQSENSRWTAVEYLFTVKAPGTITIGSFEVKAGSREAATPAFTLRIQEAPRPKPVPPAFKWEKIPAALIAGQQEEISLVLSNWDMTKAIPRNIFGGKVPENFILEELPFTGPGEDNLIYYPVRIIALTGERLQMGPLSVQFEGGNLEIPRLNLPVTVSSVVPLPGAIPEEIPLLTSPDREEIIDPAIPVPFPQDDEKVFPLIRKEYEGIVTELRGLWEQGHYAQALAEIRRHERDSFSGPSLIFLRRKMEESLGLSLTWDESWHPWNFPAFPWIILVLLAVSAWGILKIRVTSRFLKGYKNVVVFLILGGLGIFLLIFGLGSRLKTAPGFSGPSAVLERTAARRVPDQTGVISAQYSEGQPVKIRSSPGQWVFAESMDGRSGWVPVEAVISY